MCMKGNKISWALHRSVDKQMASPSQALVHIMRWPLFSDQPSLTGDLLLLTSLVETCCCMSWVVERLRSRGYMRCKAQWKWMVFIRVWCVDIDIRIKRVQARCAIMTVSWYHGLPDVMTCLSSMRHAHQLKMSQLFALDCYCISFCCDIQWLWLSRHDTCCIFMSVHDKLSSKLSLHQKSLREWSAHLLTFSRFAESCILTDLPYHEMSQSSTVLSNPEKRLIERLKEHHLIDWLWCKSLQLQFLTSLLLLCG